MGYDPNTTIYFGELITTATSGSNTTTNTNGSGGGINGNAQFNNLLDANGFTTPTLPLQPLTTGSGSGGYYYTHINYEGENIQRPGGTNQQGNPVPPLDPDFYPESDGFTKAITFFYTFAQSGWIEKTVNATGTFIVYYGSAAPVAQNNWEGLIYKKASGSTTYTLMDTVLKQVVHKKVSIPVNVGDTIRISDKGSSIIFLYAIVYPGT